MNTLKDKKSIEIDWVPVFFLTLTPLLAIISLVVFFATESFQPGLIGLFFFFYFATGLSITAGYHRLYAHRAYEANAITRLFFLLFGAAAFQNSVKNWCTDHRIHHRYVDKELDPYCIKKGFWYAHITWMFQKNGLRSSHLFQRYSKDFRKDPMVEWQHNYYLPIAAFMSFVVPAVVGHLFLGTWLGGLVFGGFVRMVMVHHFTFFINSLAHYWGSRPYTEENSARDNGVIAIFTYGEGYHNFHHLFQNDYRNGIRWYHYDPTKWLIRILSFVKFTKGLRRATEYEIFAAKMKVLEAKEKASNRWNFETEQLMSKFKVQAQISFENWKTLYQDSKQRAQNRNSDQLKVLRYKAKNARREFAICCLQWRMAIERAQPLVLNG